MDPSIERLWRKRADFDARLLASRADGSADSSNADKKHSAPSPSTLTEAAEALPSLSQPPKLAGELQTSHPLQVEMQRPQALSSTTSSSRPSSGFTKRMVSSISRPALLPKHPTQSEGASGSQQAPATSSIAMAAMKYSHSSRDDGSVVSGINLMGHQLDATMRRMNQSSVLQRGRTKGMADIKAENTLMLFQAVACNDSNTVNSMLQKGSGCINDTDSSGNTLCHVACMNNSSESLLVLFQHGAEPSQANSSALLPLHVAASQDAVECVQLITRRFPLVQRLRGGRQQLTALQMAQTIGAAPQILQCLADQQDGSVEESDIYTGVVLQESGNSLASMLNKTSSSTFKKLEAMLMQAERLRDVKFVIESIPHDKLAGVLNGRSETGMTLLHCACRRSSASVVLYLIKRHGMQCGATSATGDCALHIAVTRVAEEHQSFASIRVLQALLSCVQAEWITMFNSSGLNPLHLAAKLSCVAATKLILSTSPHAVLCCTETSGQNIIHIAAQREQLPFTEFLLCCVKHAGFSASNCSVIQDKAGRTARLQAASAHENGGRGRYLFNGREGQVEPSSSAASRLIFSVPAPLPWFVSRFDSRIMACSELWPSKPPVCRLNAELLTAIQHGSHLAVEAFILSRLVTDDMRYSELEFGSVSVTAVSWAAALHHEKVALLLMRPSFDFLAAIGRGGVSLLVACHSNPIVFSTILRELHRDRSSGHIVEHDRTTMFSFFATSNFTGNSIFHLLSALDAHIPLILCLALLSPLPVTECSALINVAIEILQQESKNQPVDADMMRLWNTLCSGAIRYCSSCELVSKALRLQNALCDSAVHVAVKHSSLDVIAHVVVRVDCNSILCADALGNTAIHVALQARDVCAGLLTCLLQHTADLESALIAENLIGDTCLSMAVRHPNPHVFFIINYCTAHNASSFSLRSSSDIAHSTSNASSSSAHDDNCNALGYSGIPRGVCVPDSLLVIVLGSDRPRASILQYAQRYAASDNVAAFFFAAWCGRRVDCRALWKKFSSLDTLLLDSNGNCVLHYLATCDSEASVLANVPGIISDMAAFGLNFSIKNKYGFTPLHLAVIRSSTHHSSLSVQGFAVLMAFLTYSHGVLREMDANMNTVLHLSCFVGNLQLVDVLMSRAVDSTVANARGLTPLQIASQQGHSEVASLLQERMTLLLFKAARRKAFQFLLPLLNAGARSIMTHSHTPILHIVAEAFSDASRDSLRALVEWGVSKDCVEIKNNRDVLMHVCCRPPGQWSPATTEDSVLKTVELLCRDIGLGSSAVDSNGQTAFFLAIASRMERVSLWLLTHAGADPHSTCPNPENPSKHISASEMAVKFSMQQLRQYLSQSSSGTRTVDESSSILERTMRSMGLMVQKQSVTSSLAQFLGTSVKAHAVSFSLEVRAATFIQRAFRSSFSRQILRSLKEHQKSKNVVRLQRVIRGRLGRRAYRAFSLRFNTFNRLNLLLQSLWSRELRMLHNRVEYKLQTVQHNAATILQCNSRAHYSRYELTRLFLGTVFIRYKTVVQNFCVGIILKRRACNAQLARFKTRCCLTVQCAFRQHRARSSIACLVLLPHVLILQCAWRRRLSGYSLLFRLRQSRSSSQAAVIQRAWRVRCAFHAFLRRELQIYEQKHRDITIMQMRIADEAEAQAELVLEAAQLRSSMLIQRGFRSFCARRKASALKFFVLRRGLAALKKAYIQKRFQIKAKLTVHTMQARARELEAAIRIQNAWKYLRCRSQLICWRRVQAAFKIQSSMRHALAVKAMENRRKSRSTHLNHETLSPLMSKATWSISRAVHNWNLRKHAWHMFQQQMQLVTFRFHLVKELNRVQLTTHLSVLQCAIRCHWARREMQQLQNIAYSAVRCGHIRRLAAASRAHIARFHCRALSQLRSHMRLCLHIMSIHKFIVIRRFAVFRNIQSAALLLQSVARGHASKSLVKQKATFLSNNRASNAIRILQCCWRVWKSANQFKARAAYVAKSFSLKQEAGALLAEVAVTQSSSREMQRRSINAATIVQRSWRRFASFRVYAHIQTCYNLSNYASNSAAVVIQHTWRQFSAVSACAKLRNKISFEKKLLVLQCAARRWSARRCARAIRRMRSAIIIQCFVRFARSLARAHVLRWQSVSREAVSVLQRSYRCHRARLHPISWQVHVPARELLGLPHVLKYAIKAQRARHQANVAAISRALALVHSQCVKLQKVVRGWLARVRIIRPLAPPLSAAWSFSLQPSDEGSHWEFGSIESLALSFPAGHEVLSILQQPSLQDADRLLHDARAVPEPHVVMSCVGVAVALKQNGHVVAAAGFMLKAKILASRLWSDLRIRFLIWALDGYAYILQAGGAIEASILALDEAISLASGELNRDSIHDLILLTLHLHRIAVVLQLPLAYWRECSQKAHRSLQESLIIISSLFFYDQHKRISTRQTPALNLKKNFPLRKSIVAPLLLVDSHEQRSAAHMTIFYLNKLLSLSKRLQTAVVARFQAQKMHPFCFDDVISSGNFSRAPPHYHVSWQAMMQPLYIPFIIEQIVAVNAAFGGKSVAQSAHASRSANDMTRCGISRSSAGALVALLHTHLQMCQQIQSSSSQIQFESSPHSIIWVPTLTLLHLTGMGESTMHPVDDLQHQEALRSLADMIVDNDLSFKYLNCVNQWTTEALPTTQQFRAKDAYAEAHQLRLQHVGEVLPIRAVMKGLNAVLNSSSCTGVQVLLHAVAAIDTSMLALMHHAHVCARQLLQLSDVTLSSVCFQNYSSFEATLTTVIAKHSDDSMLSDCFQTHSHSTVDLIVSANKIFPFLRAASNAIHFDSLKLQENIQILVFKLCSAAITAQRLVVESQLSSKIDFPCLHDCFVRGSRVCSEIRQSAIRISQACDWARNCGLLQTAIRNSEFVHKSLAQVSQSEAAQSICSQYAQQLQLCSCVVLGQLEGCAALHLQAISLTRLAWDIEALLSYGQCTLMKKLSHISEPILMQMFAASADMIDSDCEMHGITFGDSGPFTWAPLLRKCSGYSKLLQIMRHGHRDLSQAKPGSANSKNVSLLLLYCVENRELREQLGGRPTIDITDIKFPSPRRIFVKTTRVAADLAAICARRSSYRARILHFQHGRILSPPFLMRSLSDFAFDAATSSFGLHDEAKVALPPVTFNVKFGIQFNAWKPHPSMELHVHKIGAEISSQTNRVVASTNSCNSRPRTATSVSSASISGFIASDDGGSSAFSDSSEADLDLQTMANVRRSSASLRFSGRAPVQRRPQTSSSHYSESRSDARSLKQFRDQTSSARALSTAALLQALSCRQSNTNALQVEHLSESERYQQTHRSSYESAAATRRTHGDSRSRSPTHSGRSRPSSAGIPISMKNKSLELLTMAPKAFMQQQQQQRKHEHSMQQP